jgi:hypothetical protein
MKRALAGSLLLAMMFAVFVMGAAPGVAAGPSQSCAHLTGSATLSPGLTGVPADQTVTAKGTLTSCAPSATTGGSGTISATIKIKKGSCQGLATGNQSLSGTAVTKWKNGKSSTYSVTFKTGTGSNIQVATITGKVSAGLFAGKNVSGQIKFTVKAGENCSAAHPIKDITFVNTKPWVIS